MKTRTFKIALWLCAATGCAEPLTPTSYAEDYEEALCAWSSGCGVFQSRGQCRDALVWDTTGRFQYLAAAVEAGRARFDADAASACLEQIVALPCEESLLSAVLFFSGPAAAPEVCDDVYIGQVRNYDPCLSSEECAGADPVCGFPPTCAAESCCEGSCRDRGGPPKVGEACTGSCGEDAYCARDPMTNGFTVCTKRRAAGAQCADFFDSCAEGLFCDSSAGSVCAKERAAGEDCSDGGVCAGDLRCYRMGDARQCQALPGEGAACSPSNYPPCARIDNECAFDVCVKLSGPGEPCESYACVPYAECEYNNGSPVCVARVGLDEHCGAGAGSCIGHLYCDEAERCVEPEPEEACAVP